MSIAWLENSDVSAAPGRLWSLWDMMQLHAGPFLDALNRISRMAQLLGWMRAKGQTPEIPLSTFLEFKDHAEDFLETCKKLQLVLTTLSANSLVNACADVALSATEHVVKLDLSNLLLIQARVDDICGRIKDEMGLRLLLVVPANNASNYEQLKPLFGEEVSKKFPSIQFDLSESGKCLALGRGTAVVFHLMRMVEVGLGAVHSCFGLQVTLAANDRNWGNILNRIRTEINSWGNNWAEKDQFQEIFALLNATKDAWRNPTMHIEKKYTEEEAEIIFFAVRSLMNRLAFRMDENGLPLA